MSNTIEHHYQKYISNFTLILLIIKNKQSKNSHPQPHEINNRETIYTYTHTPQHDSIQQHMTKFSASDIGKKYIISMWVFMTQVWDPLHSLWPHN